MDEDGKPTAKGRKRARTLIMKKKEKKSQDDDAVAEEDSSLSLVSDYLATVPPLSPVSGTGYPKTPYAVRKSAFMNATPRKPSTTSDKVTGTVQFTLASQYLDPDELKWNGCIVFITDTGVQVLDKEADKVVVHREWDTVQGVLEDVNQQFSLGLLCKPPATDVYLSSEEDKEAFIAALYTKLKERECELEFFEAAEMSDYLRLSETSAEVELIPMRKGNNDKHHLHTVKRVGRQLTPKGDCTIYVSIKLVSPQHWFLACTDFAIAIFDTDSKLKHHIKFDYVDSIRWTSTRTGCILQFNSMDPPYMHVYIEQDDVSTLRTFFTTFVPHVKCDELEEDAYKGVLTDLEKCLQQHQVAPSVLPPAKDQSTNKETTTSATEHVKFLATPPPKRDAAAAETTTIEMTPPDHDALMTGIRDSFAKGLQSRGMLGDEETSSIRTPRSDLTIEEVVEERLGDLEDREGNLETQFQELSDQHNRLVHLVESLQTVVYGNEGTPEVVEGPKPFTPQFSPRKKYPRLTDGSLSSTRSDTSSRGSSPAPFRSPKSATQEIQELRVQLAEMEKQDSKKTERIKELEKEASHAATGTDRGLDVPNPKETQELQVKLEEIQKQDAKKADRIKELEDIANSTKKELEEIHDKKREADQVTVDLNKLRSDHEKLQSQLAESDQKVIKAQDQVKDQLINLLDDAATKEVEEEMKAAPDSNKLDVLFVKIKDHNDKAVSSTKKLLEETDSKLQAATTDNEKLQAEVAAVNEKLGDSNKEHKKLKKQIEDLTNENTKMKSEADTAKKEAVEASDALKDARKEAKTSRAALASAKEESSNATQNAENLKTELTRVQAELANTKKQALDALQHQKVNAEARVVDLQTAITAIMGGQQSRGLEVQPDATSQSQPPDLDLKGVEDEQDKLMRKLQDLQATEATLTNKSHTMKQLKALMEGLLDGTAPTVESTSTAPQSDLEKENAELRKQLVGLERVNKTRESALQTLTKQKAKYRERAITFRGAAQDKQQLTREATDQKKYIEQLQKQKNDLKLKSKGLEERITSLEKRCAQVEGESQQLLKQLQEERDKLDYAVSENEVKASEAEMTVEQIEEQGAQMMEQFMVQKAQLEAELQEAHDTIDRLKNGGGDDGDNRKESKEFKEVKEALHATLDEMETNATVRLEDVLGGDGENEDDATADSEPKNLRRMDSMLARPPMEQQTEGEEECLGTGGEWPDTIQSGETTWQLSTHNNRYYYTPKECPDRHKKYTYAARVTFDGLNRIFFYNSATNTSAWSLPDISDQLQTALNVGGALRMHKKRMSASTGVRVKPQNEETTEGGGGDGTSSDQCPVTISAGNTTWHRKLDKKGRAWYYPEGKTQTEEHAWRAIRDEKTGKFYYINSVTKGNVWKLPDVLAEEA